MRKNSQERCSIGICPPFQRVPLGVSLQAWLMTLVCCLGFWAGTGLVHGNPTNALPFSSAPNSNAVSWQHTHSFSPKNQSTSVWQGKVIPGLPQGIAAQSDKTLDRFLRRFSRYELPPLTEFQFPKNWSLQLNLGPQNWVLQLEARQLLKNPPLIAPAWQTYQGKVKGQSNSEVRLTTDGKSLTGFIRIGSVTQFIEPSHHLDERTSLNEVVVYLKDDVIIPEGIRCGTVMEDLVMPSASQVESLGKKAALPRQACGMVEMAIATHSTMMNYYKTEDAVKKRIMEILNMVEGLYQDSTVNLKIRVTQIVVEPADGHTWGDSLDTYIFLDNLMKWSISAAGFTEAFDVASLWFYSPGSGIVGLARGGGGVNTGVVCRRGQNANVIREFSRSAYSMMLDQAHELAHNFGAPHISDPTLIMNPSITGKNDQWGDSTPQTISAYRARVTCLGGCDVPPTAQFAVVGQCGDARRFSDQSLGEPTSWQWSFGDGASSIERSPAHLYTRDGVYTVSLRVSNAYGSDTLTYDSVVNVKLIPAPIAKPVSLCQASSATLTAQATQVIKWWDAPVGGQLLGSGTTYQTPVLTQAKTFYVENAQAEAELLHVGPASQQIGKGRYFSDNDVRRNYFDVFSPLTLVDAKVYASKAGDRLVEVLDKAGKVVASRKVAIPIGESRIQLNIDLEPGDAYALKLTGDTATLGLYRNETGAVFPYEIDGLISITGTDATGANGTTGYFYYFYDWQVQSRSCASPRVAVNVDLQCVPILPNNLSRSNQGLGIHWQNGRLAMRIPWNVDEDVECRALNSQGKILATSNAKSSQGILLASLPKENLGSGLVWISLKGKHGKNFEFKFLPTSLP